MALNGLKQTGIRAAGAHWIDHAAGSRKNDWLPRRQIRGEHAERHTHVLEPVGLQKPAEKPGHRGATDEAEASGPPAPDIAEPHRPSDVRDLVGGRSACVGGCDHCSGADPCHTVDRDAVALEGPEQPGMRDAAGEPTSQRETDANG